MEKLELEEYRCPCGKLLFKGLILVSLVEVKCKRCSQITAFGDLHKSKSPVSFLISVDKNGKIVDLCWGAEMLLGFPREKLIGSLIDQICPKLKDRLTSSKDVSYQIPDNSYIVRGGAEIPVKSYFFSSTEGNDPSGFHIFNTIKEN